MWLYLYHMLGCVFIEMEWMPIKKGVFMTDLYISVGIDIGTDFSFMSIALPNQTFVGKPFKITHIHLFFLGKA